MHALLLSEILTELERKRSIKLQHAEPISRGFLNEKWRLVTNRGTLFVKSYHPERYRNHMATIWQEFDQALRLQMVCHQAGVPCPRLFADEENYLWMTPSGRRFVVMEFLDGEVVGAGRMNERQMYDLGIAAARMHDAWNGAAPTEESMEPVWKPNEAELSAAWERRWEAAKIAPPIVREALELQGNILRQVRFDEFGRTAPGWTHLDLWADNLLFHPDGLSAVVDFDRIRYSYPLLDVGRAVLSCALHNDALRHDVVAAFAEGYRRVLPLPKGEILRAVRFSWITESFWWLRPGMETYKDAPKRFAQEMIWTARQWDALDSDLGRI